MSVGVWKHYIRRTSNERPLKNIKAHLHGACTSLSLDEFNIADDGIFF